MNATKMMATKNLNGHQNVEWPDIDLAEEHNILLREELAAICKNVVNRKHASHLGKWAGDVEPLGSLAKFFNNYFTPMVPVLASHISIAASAADAIDALLYNICEQGDGILVPIESDLRRFARSSLRAVAIDTACLFDVPAADVISTLERATDKAPCRIKALILTNPHKIQGQCFPQEVLESCLKFCLQRNIHLISDEEYALTAFPCVEISEVVPFHSVLSLNTGAWKCDRSRVHTVWGTNKDFGAGGLGLGCIVTQGNPELVSRLGLTRGAPISSSSTTFTAALLSSPTLPFLIALNSARLAEAYINITKFFRKRNVKYIPVSAGLNIFARMAPQAKTWDEEDETVDRLRDAGVLVSPGRQYHCKTKGKGWVRVCFSVDSGELQEALRRIDATLSSSMRSPAG